MEAGENPKNISRIYDSLDYDYPNQWSLVDYSPWLTGPVTLPDTPTSRIISPVNGSTLEVSVLRIEGIAASINGVLRVEVSPDNGATWYEAEGTDFWSYHWLVPRVGTYTFLSRMTDRAGHVETPGEGVRVTLDESIPTTSGALPDDECWSGEVVITGDVIVPRGVTLTIQPGTVIRFPALNDDQYGGNDISRSEMIVRGSLIAVGTEENPIVFSSASSSPAPGDWGGIQVVTDEADGTVRLSHATIEYASVGLAVSARFYYSSVTIDHCSIQYNLGDGINISGAYYSKVALALIGNLVRSNGGKGISCF